MLSPSCIGGVDLLLFFLSFFPFGFKRLERGELAARLTCLPSCWRIDYNNTLLESVLNPCRLIMKELQGRRDPGTKSMNRGLLLPLFIAAPRMRLGEKRATKTSPVHSTEWCFCIIEGLGGTAETLPGLLQDPYFLAQILHMGVFLAQTPTQQSTFCRLPGCTLY